MKAKRHSTRIHRNHNEPLPRELGTHLFALIKRDLLARRQPRTQQVTTQLTFAL